jgi:two-component system sensor histidine kinase KdpD
VLCLSIEDDGPGLPSEFDTPERADSLFDKFTRGVRESPRSGMGLGLAICRAIVEAHGGSIRVDRSEPRKDSSRRGVRFVVLLPRSDPPVIAEEAPLATGRTELAAAP